MIGSATYHRPLKRGGYDISFVKQTNDITEDGIKYLRMLDALRFIKSIPATTPDEVVVIMRKNIREMLLVLDWDYLLLRLYLIVITLNIVVIVKLIKELLFILK